MTSLVRRGFEAVGDGNKPPVVRVDLPTWGAFLLATTFAAFLFIIFMIEYTFGRIVPTLVMIESPQESIVFEPLPTEDPDSTLNKDPESVDTKPQPITASLRSTIRLLNSVGGRTARFRGLAIFIANVVAVNWISSMIAFVPFVPRALSNIVAAVICAQLSLTWTHIVISEPSPKRWFRRLPPMKMWRKVAVPTAVLAVAEQITAFVPIYIALLTGISNKKAQDFADMTPGQSTGMAFGGFGLLVLGIVLGCFLVLPANVVLTRVQASLLNDAEETIVPFDRSFGGKVIPEIVGGSGVVSMLDAWKTFDWASLIRLGKTYGKVFAMQVAVSTLFTLVLVAEVFMIVGKDWSKLIPSDGAKPEV